MRAPEQLRGDNLNVGSDVYGLGVLLYQLLTGRMPFEIAALPPDQAYRAIVETNPERPSTVVGTGQADTGTTDWAGTRRTTLGRLRRALAGDLDNIVLTTLRKEPQRRYASVRQLADDVRNHLRNLPIAARPDSFAYRVGKFLRRNTLSTAAVTTLLVAIVGLTLFYTGQLAKERDTAQAARELAELEQAEAEQVSEFLKDLFLSVDPGRARGNEVTAREMVDVGAEKIRSELVDQPKVRADLFETLSQVYSNLGLYDAALENISASAKLRDELAAGTADGDLAKTLRSQGIVHLERAEHDEAEAVLKRSLDINLAAFGEDHFATIDSKSIYGWLLFNSGRYDEAEPILLSAVASAQRLVPSEWLEDPSLAESEDDIEQLGKTLSP